MTPQAHKRILVAPHTIASADLGAKGGAVYAMWQYDVQAGAMLGPCTLYNNT